MGRESFRDCNFRKDTLANIERANAVIADYQDQGLRLTLRQLYYQFVSRNWITNEEKSYKTLAKTISDGRLAGLIDWDAIEDRGRQPDVPREYADLDQLVRAALNSYRLPRWKDQPYYAELWVEKQALAGVLEPMAREFHVTLMVNKGYSSQSAMYESAQRFKENLDGHERDDGTDREGMLFYLGDHDPSGEDMVRDIRERFEMFGVPYLTVKKVALTWAQIEQFNPPPNPAKLTDPRAKDYIRKHGNKSWEVDALEPAEMHRIIRREFKKVIDGDLMQTMLDQEVKDKALLTKAVASLRRKER